MTASCKFCAGSVQGMQKLMLIRISDGFCSNKKMNESQEKEEYDTVHVNAKMLTYHIQQTAASSTIKVIRDLWGVVKQKILTDHFPPPHKANRIFLPYKKDND